MGCGMTTPAKLSSDAPSRLNAPIVTRMDVYRLTTLRRRPLWPLAAIQTLLDITEEDFIHRIEDGRFPWAWNVASDPKSTRREIRALGHCVIESVYGALPNLGLTADLKFSQVIDLILPHHGATIRQTDLRRCFGCSKQLLMILHRRGEIQDDGRKLSSDGPNSSPHFTRKSVIRFLERRRVS